MHCSVVQGLCVTLEKCKIHRFVFSFFRIKYKWQTFINPYALTAVKCAAFSLGLAFIVLFW